MVYVTLHDDSWLLILWTAPEFLVGEMRGDGMQDNAGAALSAQSRD